MCTTINKNYKVSYIYSQSSIILSSRLYDHHLTVTRFVVYKIIVLGKSVLEGFLVHISCLGLRKLISNIRANTRTNELIAIIGKQIVV